MDIFLQTIGSINNKTKVKILRFIDINKEVCVYNIKKSFNMIQSYISRHLKILKDAGFLRVDRRSKWAYYSICSPLDRFRLSILNEIQYLNLEIPKLLKGCIV